jgi:hypothetical protein
MTEQQTRCPHCKGSGYLELRAQRARADNLMNGGGIVFAAGGFLFAMAIGAGFWMVIFSIFIFGVLGMMVGAWTAK